MKKVVKNIFFTVATAAAVGCLLLIEVAVSSIGTASLVPAVIGAGCCVYITKGMYELGQRIDSIF